MANFAGCNGRYVTRGTGRRLELRVEVDPLTLEGIASGDLFASGKAGKCLGSFIATVTPSQASGGPLRGRIDARCGVFCARSRATRLRITLRRRRRKFEATVEFFAGQRKLPAQYLCRHLSPAFRQVRLEQDCMQGTEAFVAYDANNPLPRPLSLAPRRYTIPSVFGVAGVEVIASQTSIELPPGPAAREGWEDSELHEFMERHGQRRKRPGAAWHAYLLMATRHKRGLAVRGVMFDISRSNPRQGCAVFSDALPLPGPERNRESFYCCVHELAHCFNLPHCFAQDEAAGDLFGPGYAQLTWTNYPWDFASPRAMDQAFDVEADFWKHFPFEFMPGEVRHLRHAFHDDIVMGGKPFVDLTAMARALRARPGTTSAPGLRLSLRAKRVYELGEPVVVELKLANAGPASCAVHQFLHPHYEAVRFLISSPDGSRRYRPLLRYCLSNPHTLQLGPARPSVYASGYLGYGADGLYFPRAAHYTVQAVYSSPSGEAVSDPIPIEVTKPAPRGDLRRISKLLLGEQQGRLFWLMGSDSRRLKEGNLALQRLAEDYREHPLAVHAQLVRGINAGRVFRSPGQMRKGRATIRMRMPNYRLGVDQLEAAEAGFKKDFLADNLTLNYVMRKRARMLATRGDAAAAEQVYGRILDTFIDRMKGALEPHIRERILEQVKSERDRSSEQLNARQQV